MILKCYSNNTRQFILDYAGTDVHHERHIKAFQNKVIINSNATIELQNALDNNHFFIS